MSTTDSDIEIENPPTGADLLALIERLGGIAPGRVLLDPVPGTATEDDLLRLTRKRPRLYELVEGTLVEKVMGYQESTLAIWLGHLLWEYLATNGIGQLSGPDGTMRLMPGLVRIPDLAFVRREKFPGGQVSRVPIPALVPDLAIEVLSEGNTPGEMLLKLKDYFLAGCLLVWLVDPATRTVKVHTAPDVGQTLTEAETLDGGTVLPGLQLPVRRVFEQLAPSEPKPARRSRKKKT